MDRELIIEDKVMLGDTIDELSIGYGPSRPWYDKWQDVISEFEAMRSIYLIQDTSQDNVRRTTERFFTACWHLRDWLQHDNANLPAITQNHLNDHLQRNVSLQLCGAVANTSKHHTRRRNVSAEIKDVSAKISSVTFSQSGTRVTISYENGLSGSIDALTLAADCVKAWEDFFQREGIRPPS